MLVIKVMVKWCRHAQESHIVGMHRQSCMPCMHQTAQVWGHAKYGRLVLIEGSHRETVPGDFALCRWR